MVANFSRSSNSIPIDARCAMLQQRGIDYKFFGEVGREFGVFREIIKNSFYDVKNPGEDKKRIEQLLVAIELENLASDKSSRMEMSEVKVTKVPDNERLKPQKKVPQFTFSIDDIDVLQEFDPYQSTTLLLRSGFTLVVGIMKTLETYEAPSKPDGEVYFEIAEKFEIDEGKLYDVTFIPSDFSLCLGYEALQSITKCGLQNYFRDFDQEPPASAASASVSLKKASNSDSVNQVEVATSSPEGIEVISSSLDSSFEDSYNRESPPRQELPQTNQSGSPEIETYRKMAQLYSLPSPSSSFSWINQSIADNKEQQLAVKNIVESTAKPFPFIVFGPPGTGKTTVLVEAVTQLIERDPCAKILITAQANSACDDICLRLMVYIDEKKILRFCSTSLLKDGKADRSKVPANLLRISRYNLDSHELQGLSRIMSTFNIVVTTLSSCERLTKMNAKFNHIFIDECTSATEPSTLIPIMNFGFKNSEVIANVILLGDHKQLGPVVKSQISENLGLSVSLMERMMSKKRYQAKPNYNNNYVVQLLDNFRSHPAILHFSNSVFYRSQLRAKMPFKDQQWAAEWLKLSNKNFPILFHASDEESGKERHMSSYNTAEVTLVKFYVNLLLQSGIGNRKIKPDDIGVVTPYNAQIRLIREALSGPKIEIGTVENFQGREKNIMIMSTVKSQTSSIGFLEDVKRLNVMMTRARHLLIIIGNPETLSMNRNWKALVTLCHQNKAMVGKGHQNPNKRTSSNDDEPQPKRKKIQHNSAIKTIKTQISFN